MSEDIPPNELADLYDALYTLLEHLPDETHPGWEDAIRTILFGGDGLAESATNYGEQQFERNDFRIHDYRAQYGNGDRVTDFPTLTTGRPNDRDRQFVDDDFELLVAPDSNVVLPLYVDAVNFETAISLLAELPAEPAATKGGDGVSTLLNPSRFLNVTEPKTASEGAHSVENRGGGEASHGGELPPNELADLYDGLLTVFDLLPEGTPPIWRESIGAVVFGSEYLHAGASPYGEQQRDRNGFRMSEYRLRYGDGERVTDFPAIATGPPRKRDRPFVEPTVRLLKTPESGVVLPLVPRDNELATALTLLEEFPAEPSADKPGTGVTALVDVNRLLAEKNEVENNEGPTTETERDIEDPPKRQLSSSEPTLEPATLGELHIEEEQPNIDFESIFDGERRT